MDRLTRMAPHRRKAQRGALAAGAGLAILLWSLPAAAQTDGGTGGESLSTLDVLHNDVVDYSEALCKEIGTAPRDRIDELKSEYDAFRVEQEAELERIAREEAALEALRRQRDESDALTRLQQELGAEPEGTAEDEAPPAVPEAVRQRERALAEVKSELSRLEVRRRTLVSDNAPVQARFDSFNAARQEVRAAESDIARLDEEKGRRESGELKPDSETLGGLGAALSQTQHLEELSEDIARRGADRDAALQAIADALQIHPPPKGLDDLFDTATGSLRGTLYRDWQAYQGALRGVDAGIAEARAAVQAAESALQAARAATAEAETQAGGQASGSGAIGSATIGSGDWVADYRNRVEALLVARTVALLSYQLHGTVTDCIARRAAALDPEDEPEYLYIRGTIHDTCYGPPVGAWVEVAPVFTFRPFEWKSIGFILTPQGDFKASNVPFLINHPDDLVDPPGYGRTKPDGEGRFRLEFTDPNPPGNRRIVREDGYQYRSDDFPYVLEGRLRPDPSAPQGWAGEGSGSIGYRILPDSRGAFLHKGVPCRIAWSVP